ncbi:MAG: hypothetical protein KA745_00200 [Gemmatimonadales bacterium]|nr:hypothetical protein [Gemmatimonadales bacterium]
MIELPWSLWPSRAVFTPASTSRTGGRSLSNSEQIVRSGSGFWRASLTIPVRREGQTLAYRAWMAMAEGMAGDVRVPCISMHRPRDMNGRMPPASAATGLVIADHAGFAHDEVVTHTAAEAAPAGAAHLRVRHTGTPGIRPGHYFGIGDRLHLVSAAWELDRRRPWWRGGELMFGSEPVTFGAEPLIYGEQEFVVSGDDVQMLQFWPRLREPVTARTPLILGRPYCKMRLASDDAVTLDQGVGIFGEANLEFVEVV